MRQGKVKSAARPGGLGGGTGCLLGGLKRSGSYALERGDSLRRSSRHQDKRVRWGDGGMGGGGGWWDEM